ncbi:S41 family peptidase [Flavivirga eckloniae]|uniref:Tail specific protease domain-containing protein n=1 Tax=Flavivirga eckloniae TaxID=1803846 RepID=A0A2K9PLJ0_9FLAO|nr:S41 family peptidase [Flavivirga eckloniae]AUP77708.1 hypothetical protein C1H87_02855 [Flavivirga eckloniae]
MKVPIFKKEMIITTTIKMSLCLLLFFCFACKSDDNGTFIPHKDLLHGFWFVADKGYVIELAENKNVIYNISSAGCTVLDNDFNIEESGIELKVVNANELTGVSQMSLSNLKLTRLQDLNAICLPDQISKTEDPKINFEHFWSFFNDYYAFFDLRGVNWSTYKNYGNQITKDNFYDVLEDLVLLFEDGHVSISDDKNDIDIESGIPVLIERLNVNLSGDLIIESEEDLGVILGQKATTIVEKYLEGTFEEDKEWNMLWGTINNDIMYLNILGMSGYGTELSNELSSLNLALDDVMNAIKDSGISKLIIDIRTNQGGFDKVSSDIAARFVDHERNVFSKKARLGNSFTEDQIISLGPKGDFQFTGDIVLLTSPLTASAAEIFTLYVKDLPYVTIVGEHTNGGFSDILTHVLPNGAEIGLSNEVYSDTKGVVYEGIGIGPAAENKIPFLSNDDFINEKDSGIERAIELLNK